MKRRNATRSALFTSIISLLLCVSMLVGTTFAWFTDEVKSGMNNIVAGNLDIELAYSKDANTWNTVKDATDLFGTTLWEPGHTEVVYLRLSNLGTLALNYQLGINVASETAGTNVAGESFKLSDHIKFGVVEDQSTKFADRAAAVAAVTETKALNAGYTKATGMNAGDVTYMALVVYMPETVGNEANYKTGTAAPTIQLGINVLASQKTQESDSFGPNYDLLAQGGYVSDAAPAAGETKVYDIMPTGETTGTKLGTMTIPAAAVEDLNKPIEITVIPTEQDKTVTVQNDEKAMSFDVTVTNIKEGNAARIKVELNVGKGLSGVKVFHKNIDITDDATYNPDTGYVVFETTSFSPYTVVFEKAPAAPVEPEEDYDGPAKLPEGLPTATVTDVSTEKANKSLAWKSFGAIDVADPAQKLATVYKYEAADEDYDSKYDNWFCDFYVSVSQPIGEGQLFLGGEYGSYGWVGFDAPAVEANVEYALLASATAGELVTHGGVSNTSWTYDDIKTFVGTFHCGVAESVHNTDANLSGMTFTVKLCLTNPADPTQYYDVHTVTYIFP